MKYLDIIILGVGLALTALFYALDMGHIAWGAAFIPLAVIVYHGCNQFEVFADTIAGNWAPGLKGATLLAIASSLPEFFSNFAFLFVFNDEAGFAAGVATTAGSAIFNSIAIPLAVLITVFYFGVRTGPNGQTIKPETISWNGYVISNDGMVLLFVETVLIMMMYAALVNGGILTWWMGAILVGLYAFYVWVLVNRPNDQDQTEEESDDDDDATTDQPLWASLLRFDLHALFFKGGNVTKGQAWIIGALSVIYIALGVHFMAEATIDIAHGLHIHPQVTALIILAAATSLPDAIMSIKEARKGNYIDALTNVFASNTFDIAIATGLNLAAYGAIFGNVIIPEEQNNVELRVALVVLTILTVGLMVYAAKACKKWVIVPLAVLWASWVAFIWITQI